MKLSERKTFRKKRRRDIDIEKKEGEREIVICRREKKTRGKRKKGILIDRYCIHWTLVFSLSQSERERERWERERKIVDREHSLQEDSSRSNVGILNIVLLLHS